MLKCKFKSSHLGSNLVAALTSLNVNNFSHFAIFLKFYFTREEEFASLWIDGIGATVLTQTDFGLKKRAAGGGAQLYSARVTLTLSYRA